MPISALRLFIKVLVDEPPKLVTLEEHPSTTVQSLLKKIDCCEPTSNLALLYNGEELPSENELHACDVMHGATLHVICTRRTMRLQSSAIDNADPIRTSSSLARRLRLDTSRTRPTSQAGLRTGRSIETIVPSASPGAVLKHAPPTSNQHNPDGAEHHDSGMTTASEDSDDDLFDRIDDWEAARLEALPDALVDNSNSHASEMTGAVVPASAPAWEPGCDDPPADCLQLAWAAGFSPTAGIVCVNGSEVVYGCGALAVVHSTALPLQRHLSGHSTRVRVLSVHPGGRLVATASDRKDVPTTSGAETLGRPTTCCSEVLIWDAATGELEACFTLSSRLSHMCFDHDGELLACLASVDVADAKVRDDGANGARIQELSIWAWREHRAVSKMDIRAGVYRGILWRRPTSSCGARIVLLGPRTLALLTPPKLEEMSTCSFAACGRPAGTLRAAAALGTGLIITGCRLGELQFWSDASLLKRIQAHEGAVRGISVAKDGRRFATGGDDGSVLIWREFIRLLRIDIASALSQLLDPHGRALTSASSTLPKVRCLSWVELSSDIGEEAIAVGTLQGELHCLCLNHSLSPCVPLQRAHAMVPGYKSLAAHPTMLKFASLGGDGYLRLWQVSQAAGIEMLCMQPLLRSCSCVAFNGNGEMQTNHVVVGEDAPLAGRRPRLHVLSDDKLLPVLSVSVPENPQIEVGLSALRFSPNCRLLAVGCTNGAIHIMDPLQKYSHLFALAGPDQPSGHGIRICAIDWSEDSTCLRVGCANDRLCVWDVAGRRRFTRDKDASTSAGQGADRLASTSWSTASVASAWGARGTNQQDSSAWPRDLARVPCVDRSPEGDALVSGNSQGLIRMFKWPIFAEAGAGFRSYNAHGCAVEAVNFSWDDRFVFSMGSDGACLLWRHWNEPGEQELVEDGSDVEEERAARLRHCEARERPGRPTDDSESTFSTAKHLANDSFKDPDARLRAVPPWQQTVDLLTKRSDQAADVNSSQVRENASMQGQSTHAHSEQLALAWVHGYRGHDCRSNVCFSAAGDAVYPAAAVVVISGVAEGGRRKQRFFTKHTDDVLCLASHPSRTIFASGQKAFVQGGQGRRAFLMVWRSTSFGAPDDLQLLATLKGVHESAVTCAAFSSDGLRLISAGLDSMHSIAIWDWEQEALLLTHATSPRPILSLAFLRPRLAAPNTHGLDQRLSTRGSSSSSSNPADVASTSAAEVRFVVCGERELRFGFAKGGLKWQKAIFGATAEMQTLPCVAVNSDGRVLTGTRRGDLYVWQPDRHRLFQRFDAHRGPLQSVDICIEQSEGAAFATGGADGVVILWDVDYVRVRFLDLNALCKREPLDSCGRPLMQPPARGIHIRAVCWDTADGRVLVGTESNEVMRVQLLQGDRASVTLLTQAHQGGWGQSFGHADEAGNSCGNLPDSSWTRVHHQAPSKSWRTLSALTEHPRLARFATAGDDGVVKVWSLAPHKLLLARRLHALPLCIAYSPDGMHLALGCKDGRLVVLGAEELELYQERDVREQGSFGRPAVTVAAYSPDGRRLALGDARCSVLLFLVQSGDASPSRSYRLVARCTGHTGALTHLDWALDSSCFRSNCDIPELRFWDCAGKQLDPAVAKTALLLEKKRWASSDGAALYSPETRCIHLASEDVQVCALGASHGETNRLIAVGDICQQVRLLQYPCLQLSRETYQQSACCMGHASALSVVRFSFNDRYVISAGGEDLTVFVWKVRLASTAVTAATPSGAETGFTLLATPSGNGDDEDEGEMDEFEDSDVECEIDIVPKNKGARSELSGDEGWDDGDDDLSFVEATGMLGDQLGALKPWKASIFAPTNAPPKEQIEATPPDADLSLTWVYGFRGYDTRRAALWAGHASASSCIVYPAAAVVVVYNISTHEQIFFREHRDDVLGIAVHRDRQLVASGQKSYREGGRTRKPSIWVWSAADARPLRGPLVFTGCNQRWVSLLSFNVSGDLLCSVGADNDHTLVLWAWESGTALRAIPTMKESIHACRCNPYHEMDNEGSLGGHSSSTHRAGQLILAGKGFLRSYDAEALVSAGGGERTGEMELRLPGRDRAASQLSIGFLHSRRVAIGSSTGSIHVFDTSAGTLLASLRQAHIGPIHVLCEADGLSEKGQPCPFLSCGKDGAVRAWRWNDADGQLEPVSLHGKLAIDDALDVMNEGVCRDIRLRAMDWSATHGLLIGTQASELLVARKDAADCRILVQGHAQRSVIRAEVEDSSPKDRHLPTTRSDDESQQEMGAIRAVAVPLHHMLCLTGGDDAVLRLWDLDQKRMISSRAMPGAVSCVSCDVGTVSETRIAVGFETGGWQVLFLASPASKSGRSSLSQFSEAAHTQHPGGMGGPQRSVTDIRFSPDLRWLAVASADAAIYLYDASAHYLTVATCYGHSSAVTHLDWSSTSDVIRSNDRGHELRFWDAPSGQPITQASACRDLPWASYRVTLGYHCQGVFQSQADGSGVHAIDRSIDGQLLVSADDLGRINLFRFPCVHPQTPRSPNRHSFTAHASAALDCCWAARPLAFAEAHEAEEYVLSVGGFDLTLMQWQRRARPEPPLH